MPSEIERALARRAKKLVGLHSPYRPGGRGDERDMLARLLEMNHELTATADLGQGLRRALEALNRFPTIARSAVSLSLPDVTEVVVDGSREGPSPSDHGGEQSFVCTTVRMDDRPIGALAVDLLSDREEARDATEQLLRAAGEIIAQAIRIRRLLHTPGGAVNPTATSGEESGDAGHSEEPGSTAFDPELAEKSLAELVARYEKELIESALQRTRGNRARAAKLLRTTERIIGYRVQQYGIDCRAFRD